MKTKLLVPIIVACSVWGCKSTNSMYDYGEYSESYYAMVKEPTDESNAEWKTALEKIIQQSQKQALRVPPGVYANLGYIHLKNGNPEKAVEFFEKEKNLYPEAKIFMDSLIQKTRTKNI